MMSVETVMARMTELQSALAPRTPVVAQQVAAPAAQNATQFATMLNAAGVPPAAGAAAPGGGPGAKIAALAAAEVGVKEQPPGSNDSPRIAEYRKSTAGAPGPGPWCAYFASWAAKEAGVPLGNNGQGFASVDQLYAWAQSAGKANPASSGKPPKPGDLIIWDEHMGIVESVGPDGSIKTVEGNSSDSVASRTYGKDGGGAIGYVSMS